MESSTSTSTEQARCFACQKHEGEISGNLKRCARCQQAKYCSKECQTSHWSQHKASCVRPQAQTAPYPKILDFFKKDSPDSPSSETYQLLINTFRLRCEDDYTHGGHKHGIYGNKDPLPVFEDFLEKAQAANMLPQWWTADTQRDCVRMALNDTDFSIKLATTKPEIQEHYKNSMMPMIMRMAAENVYGGGYGLGQKPMPAGTVCMC